ncbi:BgTH12-01463, partial [Blumeria graminis f. sp. triticale]
WPPVTTALVASPLLLPNRVCRVILYFVIACSVAPTPLQLVAKALYSFNVLQPLSGCYL